MLNITLIESRKGFRAIVENRADKTAYVAPIYMDSYWDALTVAKEAAPLLGDIAGAVIERKTRERFPGLAGMCGINR